MISIGSLTILVFRVEPIILGGIHNGTRTKRGQYLNIGTLLPRKWMWHIKARNLD
jgi:hypothetical protein